MVSTLVSIIIPIYKVSDYLDACVESACRQSYANLEIILVDDGSPDDCPQKCDEWAEKDDRIKVIHKPNGGLSDARNAGLNVATGKYIYFLDGDDTIQLDLIETVVKHMDDGADLVAFRFMRIMPDGTRMQGQKHEIGTFVLSDEKSRHDYIINKILTEKIGWEAWSRIYRKDKIDRYNLRFADNRKIFAEDLYFCLCYCTHADKIVSIPDVLYNYMIRSDSIMNEQKSNLNIGRMNELCKALQEFWVKTPDSLLLLKDFPTIHFLIINNVLNRALNSVKSKSPDDTRTAILTDISDKTFFNKQIKGYFKRTHQLEEIFPGFFLAERLSFFRFLLDGSRIGLSLRNRILYKINTHINNYFGCTKNQFKRIKKALYSKDTIVVVGTEDFGNIGDHQIAVSMLNFIKRTNPSSDILEITASQYQSLKELLFKYIKPYHTIVLPGGGNFGNIYPFAQNIREDVIARCPQNKKIIFPQTIHFSSDEAGQTAIKKATSILSKNNNIFLFTRDTASYDFAVEHFSCACFFAPDIVLSESVSLHNERKNVLLCLRSDREGCVSENTQSAIKALLLNRKVRFDTFDTQLDYDVSYENRDNITNHALQLWSSSKLVITDRLHGMIFAAVTGTPCIALRNYNHKISGTYEFIKYLPYIKFAQTEAEIEAAFEELITMKDCCYDNTPLLPYYEKLAEVLTQK